MKSTTPVKVCAYLRMSTDDQVTSISTQIECMKELALREGYEIIQWYRDEGISASRDPEKRKGWMELLSDAKCGAGWEIVICYDFSRFSRLDCMEGSPFGQILRESGKKLHTFVEGLVDWESSEGRFIALLHSEIAHKYSSDLGARTLRGKLKAFREGKSYGKKVNYGLARKVVDPRGQVTEIGRMEKFRVPEGWAITLIPGDPVEVETVRWLFSTIATEDVGFRWMALELNKKGIPSPYGGKWQSSVIWQMLVRDAYVGDTRVGRQASGKFYRLINGEIVKNKLGKRVQMNEGMLRHKTHEGIIDRELWDVVQAKLKRPQKNVVRHLARGRGGYALKSVLYCGHCGKPMYGSRERGKKKSKQVVYLCKTGVKFGSRSGCYQWRIKERDIRSFLIGRLVEEIDMRLLALDSVKAPKADQKQATEMATLRDRKLAQLNRDIQQTTVNACRATEETRPEYDRQLQQWITERAVLLEQIERDARPVAELEKAVEDWRAWFSAAKTDLIEVVPNPDRVARKEEVLKYTPETFREMLLRHGCRVTCFWKNSKTDARCWDIERVRVQLGLGGRGGAGQSLHGNGGGDWGSGVEAESMIAAPSDTFGSPKVSDGAAIIDLSFDAADLFPHAAYDQRHEIQRLIDRGAGCPEIADHLNEKGLRNSRGRVWNMKSVQYFLSHNRMKVLELSINQILAWADAHRSRTGKWPNLNSGAVEEVPYKTWAMINNGLNKGWRGLPGGSSLSRLLQEKRGVRSLQNQPRLTPEIIIAWATVHHRRTGRWPSSIAGKIPESPGENWGAINNALEMGYRGLPGGSSLSRLLAEHRSSLDQVIS